MSKARKKSASESGLFVLRSSRTLGDRSGSVAEISALPEVEIVRQSPRMLYVQGDENRLREFVQQHNEWKLYPVTSYVVPEQRPKAGARPAPRATTRRQ